MLAFVRVNTRPKKRNASASDGGGEMKSQGLSGHSRW